MKDKDEQTHTLEKGSTQYNAHMMFLLFSWSGVILMALTIIGIPFAVIAAYGNVQHYNKYLKQSEEPPVR